MRDHGICARCGWEDEIWEVDHIIPRKEMGPNDLTNLQTLCVPCHRRKTNKEMLGRLRLKREVMPTLSKSYRLDWDVADYLRIRAQELGITETAMLHHLVRCAVLGEIKVA